MTEPPTRKQIHQQWMRRALEIASQPPDTTYQENAAHDVPVGALVLDENGRELAAERNRREAGADPTAHAEILALRAAAAKRKEWRLTGCTLVVTLEPCTMCAGALVLARIDTLVFGAWEPKTGAVGSLWDVVRDRRLNHRPEVYAGVLEAECSALMRGFFDR